MGLVEVLDCTLRDGGYCNQFRFGFENIKRIIKGLVEANIDIIECGFLNNSVMYDSDVTKFTSLKEVANVVPPKKEGKLFVALMNYGDFDPDQLPTYDGTSIDGIRVAFHKKNCKEALKICRKIKEKGYKVFVQPMVSLSYSDEEFLDLIKNVNVIDPYIFYIVDSFGVMKRRDLIRLFYLVEHNLNENILIGLHCHNNMQLAYSNAQNLVDMHVKRNLVIDSSTYGMGRGSGNLNTELFVEYLNDNADGNYNLKPLLEIIDEILNVFYQKNYWGYSLPNYLSAVHSVHPNYAKFLDDKKTLTAEDINDIFAKMDQEKKLEFDKAYIEGLYLEHMTVGQVQEEHKLELKTNLSDKKVLLIAPGKSSVTEKDKIAEFASNEDVIAVSVNFDYQYLDTDYIFFSNLRRFRKLNESKRKKCIVTSNIPADKVYLQTKYFDLLNDEEYVRDNAGLMAIKFFMDYGVKKVYLVGYDGYNHNLEENYGDTQMTYFTSNTVLDAINIGMGKVLNQYANIVKIFFLTSPQNIFINK